METEILISIAYDDAVNGPGTRLYLTREAATRLTSELMEVLRWKYDAVILHPHPDNFSVVPVESL